jgi:hypothetical protein
MLLLLSSSPAVYPVTCCLFLMALAAPLVPASKCMQQLDGIQQLVAGLLHCTSPGSIFMELFCPISSFSSSLLSGLLLLFHPAPASPSFSNHLNVSGIFCWLLFCIALHCIMVFVYLSFLNPWCYNGAKLSGLATPNQWSCCFIAVAMLWHNWSVQSSPGWSWAHWGRDFWIGGHSLPVLLCSLAASYIFSLSILLSSCPPCLLLLFCCPLMCPLFQIFGMSVAFFIVLMYYLASSPFLYALQLCMVTWPCIAILVVLLLHSNAFVMACLKSAVFAGLVLIPPWQGFLEWRPHFSLLASTLCILMPHLSV